MLRDEAIEALRVLALKLGEQIAYLPDHQNAPTFLMPDGEGEISYPAEGLLRASSKLLRDIWLEAPADIQELLKEIFCVTSMLLTLAEQIDYMWLLDKQRYQITGPFDDGWLVLRRLARLTLQEAQSPIVAPKVDFRELMKLAGFQAVSGTSHQ